LAAVIPEGFHMTIGPYTHEENIEQLSRFYGHIAPGLMMGGSFLNFKQGTYPKCPFKK
jgi:hypothetical protein